MVSSVMFLYVVGGYIPLCTSVSNSDTSCYDIYKMDSGNMDRMTCTGEHIVYHCIPNEKYQEVEICVQWKWITPGYCPYYDSPSNAIKERKCSYYCLRRDDLKDICICSSSHADNISCKTECGNDFTSDKYIVCEEEQLSTVARRDTTILSATQKSVITYEKGRNSSNSSGEERNYSGSYIGITCGILIPLILAAVAILLLRKDSTEEKENNRDIEGHPNENAPLFEGNEQDIKRNVAENNEGLQQAGTDEFLERLKCGTIQTTKKILLNVVMENVANYPRSYEQNESEKEMVKELLPEDSKGFINSDLGSVAVSYAILRLSLKKEHQPKSGWGQGIKDTDTGLGDDVERLYKVYTLFKGIQSAGEVTVDEYVKLYEMLIDAFQRLGEKEDYQEFVTGCANLQRKLWYMDKLKTMQRFLPNWSWESGDSD